MPPFVRVVLQADATLEKGKGKKLDHKRSKTVVRFADIHPRFGHHVELLARIAFHDGDDDLESIVAFAGEAFTMWLARIAPEDHVQVLDDQKGDFAHIGEGLALQVQLQSASENRALLARSATVSGGGTWNVTLKGARPSIGLDGKAKASVAIASQTPPSLRTGNDSTAPTTAARAAPTRAAASTDRSYRSASWNTVKAPTAAKAPWQREICPANPVTTVMER